MKKFLLSTFALSALLLASCSNEEVVPAASDGAVVFNISMPNEMATRADDTSDGLKATQLSYAVYESGKDVQLFGNGIAGSPTASFTNLEAKLSLNLAKGKEYDIIFWADQPGNTFYTFNPATKSVSVKYDGITGNDENRDAFFASETLTVTGAMTQNVELKRPFAQLNFTTSDLAAAEKAGFTFGGSTVTVSKVYKTLNLLDGTASDEAEVTYAYATIFEEASKQHEGVTADASGNKLKYNWLSMNYLLTGEAPDPADEQKADKEVVDVKFVAGTAANAPVNTIDIANVPVQRNYRTNIYGALLTSTVDFNIDIKPAYYDSAYDVEYAEPGKIKMGDDTYDTVSEAITAAKTEGKSDVELVFGEGEFSANDLNVAANTFSSLTVSGQGPATVMNKPQAGNYVNGVKISFNNLTIKSTNAGYNGFQHNASETYIRCTIEKKLFLYGEALFEDCTFKNDNDYSVWTYGSKKATFKNCTFGDYGKSILIYNEGTMSTDITFENCTFNGTSINDGKAAIEVDCSFNKGGDTYTVNINNCKANGFDKGLLSGNNLWNVKKGTRFVLNVDGQQVEQGLTTDGGNNYYLNTAEGLVTLSGLVNGYYKDNALAYNTFSGKTVTLEKDIDMSGVAFTPIGVGIASYPGHHFCGTFDGNNKTISNLTASDKTANYAAAGLFGGLVGFVKDLTMTNVNITSTHYAGGIAGYCDNDTGSLINNCKVIGGTITTATEQIGEGWDNGDKAGGILGYGCVGSDKVTNCHVENVTIKAYRHFGSVVGYASDAANVTGNSAKNVTLLWDNAHDYKNFGAVANVLFGAIMGNFKNNNGSNTADNITLPQ